MVLQSDMSSWSKTSVVSQHFTECNGGNISQLKIQGVERIKPSSRAGDLTAKFLHMVVFWIFTLGTCQPAGFNLRFDFSGCV
ncbi:hypothetical protein XELAEV_18005543mg [Xenopus laevis]|uniref:Uncharacterized protein n=1 Tax=Xenopus laevis TaxID=8355 RepID=A0A974DZH7_XENLA|nr:hypothetical protein XELAEV_18005543mg [Xenopus laevis]